jgi:hypothetical protein
MGIANFRGTIRDQDFEPVGDDGLVGVIHGHFVVLKGPCGEGHVLSFANARKLRDWLDRQPEVTGHAVIDV